MHEPRKQCGEHQVVEMRGAVGETDEPDDFGMASCVGVHPDGAHRSKCTDRKKGSGVFLPSPPQPRSQPAKGGGPTCSRSGRDITALVPGVGGESSGFRI